MGLQYLYNIPKKKIGREFIFCMQMIIKVSTSWGYCFWWKVARFYGGSPMFIVTCFLAQPNCRICLPEHCNTIIKQQSCGRGVAIFFAFAPSWSFSGEVVYIVANHPMPIKQAKKSLHQALIQIISPKGLQQVPPYCNWKSILSMWCKN